MKDKEALIWIINILNKHKIPYMITGGYAARIYGSNRPLADIDIDVSDKSLYKIIPSVQKFISHGPNRYKDNNWDILGLTLHYKGQEIGISGVSKK